MRAARPCRGARSTSAGCLPAECGRSERPQPVLPSAPPIVVLALAANVYHIVDRTGVTSSSPGPEHEHAVPAGGAQRSGTHPALPAPTTMKSFGSAQHLPVTDERMSMRSRSSSKHESARQAQVSRKCGVLYVANVTFHCSFCCCIALVTLGISRYTATRCQGAGTLFGPRVSLRQFPASL
jgi:hypothetical protein